MNYEDFGWLVLSILALVAVFGGAYMIAQENSNDMVAQESSNNMQGFAIYDSSGAIRSPSSLSCTWTSWKDSDNGGGSGDWETKDKFSNVCASPVAVECQTVSGYDYLSTRQKVTCSTQKGLLCLNSENSNRCKDYKVRFCCGSTTPITPPTTPTVPPTTVVPETSSCTWSSWKDSDNPDMTGDWETLDKFTDICFNPQNIECTTTSGQNYASTGEVVSCKANEGLICLTSNNPSGCSDYKVRFCCADTATTRTVTTNTTTPITPPCQPNCAGRTCGSNGCGGTCGTCSSTQTCQNNQCVTTGTIEPAKYYVSTTGNDANPGTAAQPWKTWQKAFSTAQPGDLVYIRGGTYYANGASYGVRVSSKSGTATNRIKIFAYPGETPILDCSGVTGSGARKCLSLSSSNYWHIKGLTFSNTKQGYAGSWSVEGISISGSSNNILENVVSSGHGGPGITVNGDNNLLLNCDSHSNYDSLVGGENADGFIIGHTHNRYTNTFRGCRSYNNSDDGYDSFGFEGTAIYENCWAFNNGYGSSGDGAGFKLGKADLESTGSHQKILRNCIVANTKGDAYDQSSSPYITVEITNSTAYNAGSLGFIFHNGGNVRSVFRNNIAYKNRYGNQFLSNNILSGNSWQGATVDDADFVSLDGSQLFRKRNPDGSLPSITFLQPRTGSDVLGKGPDYVALSGTGTSTTADTTGSTTTLSTCSCIGKQCGSDGCGGSCGTCASTQTCSSAGTCVQTTTGTTTTTQPPTTTGKLYYVSPSGSDDTGDGSITKPWFTLTKAYSAAVAGDTIYMRGGTYRYTRSQILTGRNGQSGKYINIWAYPGEQPILTKGSSYTPSSFPNCLVRVSAQYIYMKDIEISYFTQTTSGIWYGLCAYDGGNNKFEQINSHHNGHGMAIRNSGGNLVLNSDFHHNSDPLTTGDAYGNADGIEIGYIDSSSTTNTLRGCRMWWNTDDGLDLWDNEGKVIVENSWAWYNGFVPGTFTSAGDGNGFKLGKMDSSTTSYQRTIKNSMAFYNKKWGFNENGARSNVMLYNNIAYSNCYKGFLTWCGGYYFGNSGTAYNLKNNIAYANVRSEASIPASTNVQHNSWQNGLSVSSDDFVSLSMTGVDGPRKADGSLPDINFLRLNSGSDLINAGTNVGTSYLGTAPDLGPFESR